jgi:hypothetical protein
MSLKLNKVADNIIIEDIEYRETGLAELLAEPEGSKVRSNARRYARAIGNEAFELGTSYYQQQRKDEEVIDKLSLAGRFQIEEISLRDTSGPKESWSPLEFERAYGLALCFGSSDTLSLAKQITPEQIFSGLREDEHKVFQLSYEYVLLLKEFVELDHLNVSRLQETLANCQSDRAAKFDSVNTAAKLVALKSIADRAADPWNKSLATLVTEHKNESLHGDLQRLSQAFIAIPALLLAKLGRTKAGMECLVKSDYLPLRIIS